MRLPDIPEPENGMVVRFHYRWADPDQPVKERPACIALVRMVPARPGGVERSEQVAERLKEVVYLPISTRRLRSNQAGLELPAAICGILGIRTPSWVILSECNVQYWPNDLARVPGKAGDWHYGFVPPRFFARIAEAFRNEISRRRASIQNVHYLPP